VAVLPGPDSELRPEPATRQQNHSAAIKYQSAFRANTAKWNMKRATCTTLTGQDEDSRQQELDVNKIAFVWENSC